MKYRATDKFKELGIENSYHQLSAENYYKLRVGGVVDITLDNNNQYLTKDGYIEKVTPEIYGKIKKDGTIKIKRVKGE